MADNKVWLERIRKQLDSSHSVAANYWDSLLPEWRGVVLHAASVHNTGTFKPYLAQYSWNELYAHIGCRGMTQLRLGILRARNMLNEFGPLERRDFTRRTANRPSIACQKSKRGAEMVIAPEMLKVLAMREHINNSQNTLESEQ